MAKYLAIEWDSSELRMALGRNRSGGIAIDETYAIPLGEDATPETIGAAIKEAVGSGVKGVETLIAIPRASVEIRQMQLPAAPPDEMPDMVRFQAMRQFTTIGDDWPLDYVELDRSEGHVQVLASVISPDGFREIQKVCEASERVAEHMCLRPFASAELLKEHIGNDFTCRLIADVMSNSADLGVMVNGQIVFMRTVRLPAVPEDTELPVQGLMGEIRRTIAAASNQLNGQQVSAVTLFGTGSRLEPLRAAIETQLKLDSEIWNPFTNARLGSTPPQHPGRYAALLGMILNQSAGVRQPIDFLNPRRRPKPKSNRERYLLYSFLTVAVVAVLAVSAFLLLQRANQKLVRLTLENETSKVGVAKATLLGDQLREIETFEEQSVNFVEELGTISQAMPGPKDARVQKLVGTLNNGEALITMDIKVSGYEHISNIENSLKSEDREINGKRSREGVGNDEFPWSFQALTTINPKKKREIARKMAEAATSATEAGLDKPANGDDTDDDTDDADRDDSDRDDADRDDADRDDADRDAGASKDDGAKESSAADEGDAAPEQGDAEQADAEQGDAEQGDGKEGADEEGADEEGTEEKDQPSESEGDDEKTNLTSGSRSADEPTGTENGS